MDMSVLPRTHENTAEIKTIPTSRNNAALPWNAPTGETSDEDGGLGQMDPLEDDSGGASTYHQLGSLSPNQLSARLNNTHPSEPSVNARSKSRGRDGYGFRPPSGTSTPSPVGIRGIRVQRGTNAVVDCNGLGWPGMCVWPCLLWLPLITVGQTNC